MNSPKNWELQTDPDVLKVLQRIPRHDAEVLLETIRLLPTNPYFGDIKKMKGKNNVWRRRIGSYRIFYRVKVNEKILLVFRIERRTSGTY